MFARLKLLFYFYQLQSFIYIGNRHGKIISKNLRRFVSIFSRLVLMDVSADGGLFATNICLPNHPTFITYTLLNLCVKTIPIAICFLMSSLLQLYTTIRNRILATPPSSTQQHAGHQQAILKLRSTAFQILMLVALSISKDLVKLLNCVNIAKHGEVVPVLFGDAIIVCLQTPVLSVCKHQYCLSVNTSIGCLQTPVLAV